MAETETFVVVKRRKNKKNLKHSKIPEAKDVDKECPDFDLKNFMKRLNACIAELEVSDFFSHSFDIIHRSLSELKQEKTTHFANSSKISLDVSCDGSSKTESCLSDVTSRLDAVHIVGEKDECNIQLLSYGIGNFTSSLIARYQLAFFLGLQKKLGQHCRALVYDPVFSSHETLVLEKYKCEVISENEEGCRQCLGPTVAFLPHCGRPLYNNLLWRNLSTHNGLGLNNLVLIGNSFSQIVERTPKSVLRDTGSYILKLVPYVTENSLPDNFILKDVFNDLAVHTFPMSAIEAVLGDTDVQLNKPLYEATDVEFIRK